MVRDEMASGRLSGDESGGARVNVLSVRDMEQHVPILGWLLIAGNAIFLGIGAFVFVLLTGIGTVSGAGEAQGILTIVGASVALLLTLLALPGIIAGYGLLTRRPWGRILAIIVAILGLVNFPIGTAIGIYVIWVLFQQAANDYFTTPRPTYSSL
jgi:hypothetical protein